MRILSEFIGIFVIIRFRRNIYAYCFIARDALKPMVNIYRDLEKHWIMWSHKEFIYFFVGRRIFSAVIEDDLHHSSYYYHIIYLLFVVMPPLDHTRICSGHVNLPKFYEEVVIGAKHFHKSSSLIGYDFKVLYFNSIYHINPPQIKIY